MTTKLEQKVHEVIQEMKMKSHICPFCGANMLQEQNSCSSLCIEDEVVELEESICEGCITILANKVKQEAT